ncbi:MAG: hypothetical protein R3B70_45955 [Polyangiaceae bacterium]
MVRRFLPLVVALLIPLSAGCGDEKKEAIEGLEKIKEACDANQKDVAKKIAEELSEKNKTFHKAFDAAIDDKRGSFDICLPTLHSELALRLEHGS